ncbi:DNA polymerase [Helicobacter suis]|uniref:DNA polymerase n=1 Tax=Helicobacter suis TaxID=104628 RepID=UPI0013D4DE7F|nr:DNA polymerase [Helicobacter suis]
MSGQSPTRRNNTTDQTTARPQLLKAYECSVLPRLENLYQNAPLKSLTIGYDTEYKAVAKGKDLYNKILLSQLWFCELGFGVVFVHSPEARLNPIDLLELVLPPLDGVLDLGFHTKEKVRLHASDKKGKKARVCNLYVNFVYHFGIAEYSTWDLAFKKAYENDFTIVRKCPLTFGSQCKSLKSLMLPVKIDSWLDKHKAYIQTDFSDTFLTYNKGLEKVGDMIGAEKIHLRQVDLDDFETFLNDNPLVALDYAINDAYVSVEAFHFIHETFLKKEFGVNSKVYTAPSIGLKAFLSHLKKPEYKGVLENITNPKGSRFHFSLDNLDTAGFIGGLNAVLKSGRYKKVVYDYDLSGCYGMMMCSFPLCDFSKDFKRVDKPKGKVDRNALSCDYQGVVKLDYKFKSNVYIPPIFPKNEHGLIHVLEDKRAEILIDDFLFCLDSGLFEDYYIHDIKALEPFKDEVKASALGAFVKEMIEFRNHYKELRDRSTIPSDWIKYNAFQELYKLIINSLYGKFGQGVNTDTPESSITNAAIAAKITGRCRLLLCEIINFLHAKGVVIYSVTTDGFACDTNLDEYKNEILNLPFVKFIRERYNKVMGVDTPFLELKHYQNPQNDPYTLFLRTRTCFMGEKKKESKSELYLAKGGIKLPKEIKGDHDKSLQYCLEVIANGGLNIQDNLTDSQEVYKKYKDLVNVREAKELNLEVDLKRKLILTGFRDCTDDGLNLTIPLFDTEPYKSVEEANKHLKAYEALRKTTKRQYKGKEFVPFKTKNFTLGGELATYQFLFYISVKSLYPEMTKPLDDLRVYLAHLLKEKGFKNDEIEKGLGFAKGKVRIAVDNYKRHEKDKTAYKLPIDLVNMLKPYLDEVGNKFFEWIFQYASSDQRYYLFTGLTKEVRKYTETQSSQEAMHTPRKANKSKGLGRNTFISGRNTLR